jgi:hypothetical protein
LAVGDLVTVAGVTPTGYNGTFVVTAVSNTSPFTVSYANATTGSQTVAGTVSAPAQASITARSAGTTGLIVRGAASAAQNLQVWQQSNGSILGFMDSSGNLISGSFQTQNTYFVAGEANNGGSMRMSKATAALAPTANYIRLQILAGTNTNTFKLVAVAPSGTAYTIVDNMA